MDLVPLIRDVVRAEARGAFVRATVTGTNGNLVLVRRQGETDPDPAGYPRLASYTPSAGDEVLLTRIGGGYIVLGKVLR